MKDWPSAEVVAAHPSSLEVRAEDWFVREVPPGTMLHLTKAGYTVRVKSWGAEPTPEGTRIVEIEPA